MATEHVTTSLCESCKNMREVRTARSRFLRCELSVANAAYPKYPPQPLLRCDGFVDRSKSLNDFIVDKSALEEQDAAAIREALADVEAGRVTPLGDSIARIRQQLGLP